MNKVCAILPDHPSAQGVVQTYLPASVFANCAKNKWPQNTLFPDVDGYSIAFEDMKRYLPLILAFYQVSPMGSMDVFSFS